MVSLSGYGAALFSSGSQSTYICPIILKGASHLQMVRLANALIDSVILIGVAELCHTGAGNGETRRKRTLISLGAGLIVSSTFVGVDGCRF